MKYTLRFRKAHRDYKPEAFPGILPLPGRMPRMGYTAPDPAETRIRIASYEDTCRAKGALPALGLS